MRLLSAELEAKSRWRSTDVDSATVRFAVWDTFFMALQRITMAHKKISTSPLSLQLPPAKNMEHKATQKFMNSGCERTDK